MNNSVVVIGSMISLPLLGRPPCLPALPGDGRGADCEPSTSKSHGALRKCGDLTRSLVRERSRVQPWWQCRAKALTSIREAARGAQSCGPPGARANEPKLAAHGEGQTMDPQTLIIWLVIGAVAGWLAGLVMTGGGFGLVGNIVVGIVGAFVAGWLLPGFWPMGGIPGRSSMPRSVRSSSCSWSASSSAHEGLAERCCCRSAGRSRLRRSTMADRSPGPCIFSGPVCR